MVQLWTDSEGPGSFDDMVEYVEQVLRENFTVIPEKDMTGPDENQYHRRARNIVMSLMSRQKIEINHTILREE